jgi:hypothetical protein
VDEVHAMIGTGREERVGAILAAVAARDAAAAVASLDAAVEGGADPGGVLDQLVAALRDCLLASVGCGPELMQEQGSLGVDVADLGRRLGTATLLAMLQILDQALARMNQSGHAGVLAEMAVVRLAKLEDLDQLADLVAGLTSGSGPGPAERPAPVAGAQPVSPSSAGRPVPSAAAVPPARPAEPPRQKKTVDLTQAQAAEPSNRQATSPVDALQDGPERLPEDALAAWRLVGGRLDGLAADFAATASAATWKDGNLEVVIPAAAALSFLNRAEVSGAIARALGDAAGRPVRCALVPGAAEPAPGPSAGGRDAAAGSRPAPLASQSELLRAAAEHPLVAHARDLFDAAIRRVDQRPRSVAPSAAAGGTAAGPATAVADADGDAADSSEMRAGDADG